MLYGTVVLNLIPTNDGKSSVILKYPKCGMPRTREEDKSFWILIGIFQSGSVSIFKRSENGHC